jgi:tRNA (guanine37-N1)-methyltransferase
MRKESLCIKVPKTHAEKTLFSVNALQISDRELELQKNADFIYIPIIHPPSEEESAKLKAQIPDFQLEVRSFPERKRRAKTFVEALENKLPPHLLASLPRALDIVGDIAIIDIPPELKTQENLIGEAILERHRNVRTVLAKIGVVTGTFRLREFEVISGEPRTDTVHKEFGCKFYVDVAKAYFSPRLSHEHKRVAELVQKGETVVDLFAGVGPFSVLIAKRVADAKVYAVDINPDAVEFLKKNVRLNRVENRVFPILGDAKQIVENELSGIADRVIMNLPERAEEYVDAACNAMKPSGGTVHYYGFVRLPDSLEALKLRFSEAVEKAGRKVDRSLFAKTIRATAPYEWQVVVDAKIL